MAANNPAKNPDDEKSDDKKSGDKKPPFEVGPKDDPFKPLRDYIDALPPVPPQTVQESTEAAIRVFEKAQRMHAAQRSTRRKWTFGITAALAAVVGGGIAVNEVFLRPRPNAAQQDDRQVLLDSLKRMEEYPKDFVAILKEHGKGAFDDPIALAGIEASLNGDLEYIRALRKKVELGQNISDEGIKWLSGLKEASSKLKKNDAMFGIMPLALRDPLWERTEEYIKDIAQADELIRQISIEKKNSEKAR